MNAVRTNTLGQPIGFDVPEWRAPVWPARSVIEGRHCNLEPIDERFAPELYAATRKTPTAGAGLTWPMARSARGRLSSLDGATCLGDDPLFFAIIDRGAGTPPASRATCASLRQRLDRGGAHPLLAALQRSRGGHRSDVPDDAARVRTRLPPLRVEVRRAERAFARRRASGSALVRRHLPAGDGLQGPQPRHGLVRGDRPEWPALRAAFEQWLDPFGTLMSRDVRWSGSAI